MIKDGRKRTIIERERWFENLMLFLDKWFFRMHCWINEEFLTKSKVWFNPNINCEFISRDYQNIECNLKEALIRSLIFPNVFIRVIHRIVAHLSVRRLRWLVFCTQTQRTLQWSESLSQIYRKQDFRALDDQ